MGAAELLLSSDRVADVVRDVARDVPRASAAVAFASSAHARGYSPASRSRLRPASGLGEVRSAPGRVLLVEPDRRLKGLLELGLVRAGFEVLVVESAQEAERLLSSELEMPGVIVAEAEMPERDGFALCASLRRGRRTAGVPVLLLSRDSGGPTLERASAVGADDVLRKPLHLQDVVAQVQLLAGRPAEEPLVGDTRTLPLRPVLRALLSGARSGELVLDERDAWVRFCRGRIVDARFGVHEGEQAIERLLTLAEGTYEVDLGPALVEARCAIGLEQLCGRLSRATLEVERLRDRLGSLAQPWWVEPKKLADDAADLPAGLIALARLCDGVRPLRSVLEDCELSPALAARSLLSLEEKGIVQRRPVSRELRLVTRGSIRASNLRAVTAPRAPVRRTASFESLELPVDVKRQLEAFRIRPVVEPLEGPSYPSPEPSPAMGAPDASDEAFVEGRGEPSGLALRGELHPEAGAAQTADGRPVPAVAPVEVVYFTAPRFRHAAHPPARRRLDEHGTYWTVALWTLLAFSAVGLLLW